MTLPRAGLQATVLEATALAEASVDQRAGEKKDPIGRATRAAPSSRVVDRAQVGCPLLL